MGLTIRGGGNRWIDVKCLVINNMQAELMETRTRLNGEGPMTFDIQKHGSNFPSALAPTAEVMVTVRPRWYEGKPKRRTQTVEFVIHP